MADLHKSSFARLACSTSSSDVFFVVFFLIMKRFHDDDADNVVSSINIKLSDLFYLHLFEEDLKLGSWVHSNCHWFLLDAFFPSKVFSPAMVKRELLGTNATNVHVSRKDDAKNVTFLNRKLNVYLSSFRQNLANINGTVDALNGHVCVKLRMSFSGEVCQRCWLDERVSRTVRHAWCHPFIFIRRGKISGSCADIR